MENFSNPSKLQNIMELSGNIGEKDFLSVFEEISVNKISGVLKVKHTKKEWRFYFREGILVYSENSKIRTDELVLEMIKNSGFVTRDTIIKSEGKKSKIMKSLLEILIDEGHVSMLLYSKIISATVRINVIKAAFLSKGAYSFEYRKSVREVHGVRPLEYQAAAILRTFSDEKRQAMRKILGALYFNVTGKNETDYLAADKPFLQNFLATELDFIGYLNRASDDFIAGKWIVQSRFMTPRALDTAARYAFRTFVFATLCSFLYLATMTTTFAIRKDHHSIKDFYFFKISLLSSLYSFETGEPADTDKLIINSLLTKEDIIHSGIENVNTNKSLQHEK